MPSPENEELYRLSQTVTKDGELLDLDKAGGPTAAGMRMLSAFLSGQYGMTRDLFTTAIKNGLGSDTVQFMLSICLSLSANYLDEQEIEIQRP